MITLRKTTSKLALLFVLSMAFVVNVNADAESIANQLRESGYLSDSDVASLEFALKLREDNRQSIHSLAGSFTTVSFRSPQVMQREASERYHGVVPVDALPNPWVVHVYSAWQDGSVLIRNHYPYGIAPHFMPENPGPLKPMEQYFTPLERRREFVETEIGQMSVSEDIPLVSDGKVEHRKWGMFSKEGALQPFPPGYKYNSERHEESSLESIASSIAYGTGVVEDLNVAVNEEGKRLLTMAVKYDRQIEVAVSAFTSDVEDWRLEEWLYVSFSLDDAGLLHGMETYQIHENLVTGQSSIQQVSITDVSFAEFDTYSGRVVLPTNRLFSITVNDELREQNLWMVNLESIRVNEELPDEVFRVNAVDAAWISESMHNPPPPSPETIDDYYTDVNELPEDIRALTITAGLDGLSSAEHFPFDKEWNEMFLAFGGTGGGGSTPFGHIELARYAQTPTPRVYSGVSTFWWLNNLDGTTTALIGGLLLVLVGIAARNLAPRRTRQTATQSV